MCTSEFCKDDQNRTSLKDERNLTSLRNSRVYRHDFYGVVYSAVECVCGVTLSVYPHWTS